MAIPVLAYADFNGRFKISLANTNSDRLYEFMLTERAYAIRDFLTDSGAFQFEKYATLPNILQKLWAGLYVADSDDRHYFFEGLQLQTLRHVYKEYVNWQRLNPTDIGMVEPLSESSANNGSQVSSMLSTIVGSYEREKLNFFHVIEPLLRQHTEIISAPSGGGVSWVVTLPSDTYATIGQPCSINGQSGTITDITGDDATISFNGSVAIADGDTIKFDPIYWLKR